MPAPIIVTVADHLIEQVQAFTLVIGHRLAGDMTSGARLILAATTGIALLKVWFETMLDDSLVEGLGDALNILLQAFIILSAITHVDAINQFLWASANEMMAVMSPDGTGDVQGVVSNLWSAAVDTAAKIWDAASQQLSASSQEGDDRGWWEWIDKSVDATAAVMLLGVNTIISLIVTLIFIVYFAIMLLQLFVGVFRLALVGALYPLAIAFYPIFSSWTLNVISAAASAIIHLGVVAFLIGIVGEVVKGMTAGISDPNLIGTGSAAVLEMVKMVALLMSAVFMMIVGMATSSALSAGAGLFSGAGGMIGSLARRHGGGGGGNKGGGDAGPSSSKSGKEESKSASAGAGGSATPVSGGEGGAKLGAPPGGGGTGGGTGGGGVMDKLNKAASTAGAAVSGGASAAGQAIASGGAKAAQAAGSGISSAAQKAGKAIAGAGAAVGGAAGGAVGGALGKTVSAAGAAAGWAVSKGGGLAAAGVGKAVSGAGAAAGKAIAAAPSAPGKAARATGTAMKNGAGALGGAAKSGMMHMARNTLKG